MRAATAASLQSEDYAAPYENLKSLPAKYLKPGSRFEQLDGIAKKMSDTDCAKKLGAAKQKLLRRSKSESLIPPRFP